MLKNGLEINILSNNWHIMFCFSVYTGLSQVSSGCIWLLCMWLVIVDHALLFIIIRWHILWILTVISKIMCLNRRVILREPTSLRGVTHRYPIDSSCTRIQFTMLAMLMLPLYRYDVVAWNFVQCWIRIIINSGLL